MPTRWCSGSARVRLSGREPRHTPAQESQNRAPRSISESCSRLVSNPSGGRCCRVKPGNDEGRRITGKTHCLDSSPPNSDKASQVADINIPLPEETSMSESLLESTINAAFDARDGISTATKGEVREAVDHALDLLDKGEARVAERKASGNSKVHQSPKKAPLLSVRLNDMSAISGGPGKASWWDKVPSKFEGWGENRFRAAGFRAVPGAIVPRSA